MRTIKEYLLETRNLEIPKEEVSGEWFTKHNLPMVVSCKCCEMSMILFSASVDEDGYCYCEGCAREE